MAIVGAYSDDNDNSGTDSGSVFAFRGLTTDCNNNRSIDLCDIAEGTSEDCNRNGIPDECDLTNGTSQDDNGNGIPDECDGRCTANELAKLLADDGAERDNFGNSVSIDSNVAIVGAPENTNENGDRSGAAYIFRFDGRKWNQETKLLPSDGIPIERFGFSVSISGNVIIVGALFADGNSQGSGAAYIFRFDGANWRQEAKLVASDGMQSDYFGVSVSIDDDVAIIGADKHNNNRGNPGSAYIFRFDGTIWNQEAKLLASDGNEGLRFGNSVSISSDVAIIGDACDDNGNGYNSGSAFIFRFDGMNWTEEAKLLADDGMADDIFGKSVSVSGDVAIVGSLNDGNDNGRFAGSAYIFRFNGANWRQETKLLADEGGTAYALFGNSVSIDSDLAIVGSFLNSNNGSDSGAAFVYSFDGSSWTQQTKLLPSDAALGDRFGFSVAIRGNETIVGTLFDDDNGSDSGSAYVFRGLLDDCNDDEIADICDFANGISEDCNTNGVPDECDIADGTSQDENGDGIPDECDCTGNEEMKKPICKKNKQDINKMKVKLVGGKPGDTFTVKLSTRKSRSGEINENGKAKVKFKRLPFGGGAATATWDCGVTKTKNYYCP